MRRPPACLATLAAIALGACGDVPVDTDDTFRARVTLETFLSECAAGKSLEALEILSEPAQRAFLEAPSAAAGCDRILRLTPLADDAEEGDTTALRARERFEEAHIVELSVTGGLAEARLRAADQESTVELEDTGERWTVTNARLP